MVNIDDGNFIDEENELQTLDMSDPKIWSID